jgi:hypothetical protein
VAQRVAALAARRLVRRAGTATGGDTGRGPAVGEALGSRPSLDRQAEEVGDRLLLDPAIIATNES